MPVRERIGAVGARWVQRVVGKFQDLPGVRGFSADAVHVNASGSPPSGCRDGFQRPPPVGICLRLPVHLRSSETPFVVLEASPSQ